MLIKPTEIKYINMHWQIIFSTFIFFQYTKKIVRICRGENMKILQGKHQEDK